MGIAEMKPFDLDAAKRGEPICLTSGGKPYPVLFVGTLSDGRIAFEDDGVLSQCSVHSLFMTPKKRTVWINVYESSLRNNECEGTRAAAFFTEEGAKHNAKFDGAGVLASAIPIEIED